LISTHFAFALSALSKADLSYSTTKALFLNLRQAILIFHMGGKDNEDKSLST
jgi:hypothetical protein